MQKRQSPKQLASLRPVTDGDALSVVLDTGDSSKAPYPIVIINEPQLMTLQIPKKEFIVTGLIPQGSITLISGYRGVGKSWLISELANEITWGGQIGPWLIKRAVNTLLVDGEMSLDLLQERFRLLNVGRDIRWKPATLSIYAESYAYKIGVKRGNLLDAYWRNKIYEIVSALGVEVLIIDNLSSLAPGIDENAKLDFDPINRWLLELRFGGVTTIMAHHTGKGGDQRGTTSHEDHVDLSIMLKRPKGYKLSQGCRIEVVPSKDREHVTSGESAILQLQKDAKGALRLLTDIGPAIKQNEILNYIIQHPDMPYKEVINKFQISSKTYYRLRRQAFDEPTQE